MAQIFRKSWNSDTLVIDLLSVEFSNLPKEPLLKDAKIEEITQIDAVLKWETSEDTISKIKFLDNNCPSQGCEINVDVYNTSHIQTLKGLSANTDYLVKIVSISRTGITAESEIIKFKTKQIPIPAPAPVILPQIEKLVYTTGNNTEIQSSFEWDSFRFPNFIYLEAQVNAQTTKIKYFFKNQPGAGANSEKISSVAVNGKISIILQNPKELGIYDLALIPIGKNNEEGEIIYKQVNIISNKELYIPDIKRIQYAQSIIEKDFGIRDYNIVLNVETFQDYKTNSYLSVKLEKQESDSILEKFLPFDETNPNKVSTLSFYAKDFLEKYKNKFVETDTTIIINFILEIYSVVGDKKIFGKPETVTLKIVKGNYQITDDEAIDKLSQPFIKLFSGNDTKQNYEDKISFEDDKYFYYRLRYETDTSQKSLPILNIGKDDVTYSLNGEIVEKTEFLIDDETGDTIRVQKTPYPTLVIKLAEPLPTDVDLNSLLWISRQITPTIVQDILISEIEEDECNTILPNFNTEDLDDGGYEYFGKLVAEGSQTSTDIVNTFISSSNFNLTKLNINYTSGSDKTSESFIVFSNFVNFSGAQTRINNYQYKLSAVEFYNQKISASLYSGTTLSTSSYSLLTSESFNSIINGIKNGFDGFEKTLYNNFDVTSSNSTFFEYQREYAEKYDKENKNYLIRHIPSHLSEAGDNDEFLLFLEMIGQHFDVLWSYITGIKNKNNITNLSTKGISDTLVYNLLESFGWDPRTPFKTAELWKEAFGKNADGTTTSNINQVGESILTTYSYKDARNEIWRRILNNLPYLLKHKGTKRAVNAILTCYGVPSSLLTIIEFGGPNIRPLSSSTYTYDDRTAAINLSETEYITVPYISSSGYVATSVQTRFKTDYKIPKSTSITGSQIIRKESVDGYWQVSIVPNFTSSFGDVIFTLKNLPTTETIQLSVTESVLFDDYWKNITIQKERFVSNSINYDRFDLFVKEAIDGRIIMNQSASAIHTASAVTNIFTNSGSLYLNSFNSTKGIDGTYDEFRIWNTALSESVVNAHALNPDVIYGNGIYSSTDNLLLRLDFEWPKDRIADPYIKNVSPSVTFSGSKAISGYAGYATASISTVSTTYPYQYEVYERSVTATIPSIGFAPNDKVRFEDVELVTDLSHISRATKKSFDRSSMDSNRIGLFFSPVKELNLDILKSLGPINIGDYIGDWQDEYGTDRYKDLDALRNYYFKRTNLSFEEYIKLVKSIDKSLFEMLLQVLPARAKINQGLLLEPSILERNKIKINKPTGNKVFYTSSISTQNTSFIEGKYDEYNTILNVALDRILTSSLLNLETNIKIVDNIDLDSEKLYYTSSIKTSDDIVLLASIIKNSISTMGGLEVEIDTRRESSVTGEYDQELSYESVGMDKDSPFTAGFGLVGQNGFVDRTYFKNDGTVVLTERNNAYILTIKYTRDIPNTNLSGITTYEKVEKLKKKLVIVDSEVVTPGSTSVKSALAHSFYTNISSQLGTYRYDKGVVVEIYPFDGITYGHYRFVGDLTKGLQNSFYEGSKQTSLTTIDGTPAVETFTTNPNRLKISDSGRGSGEPILEVD